MGFDVGCFALVVLILVAASWYGGLAGFVFAILVHGGLSLDCG